MQILSWGAAHPLRYFPTQILPITHRMVTWSARADPRGTGPTRSPEAFPLRTRRKLQPAKPAPRGLYHTDCQFETAVLLRPLGLPTPAALPHILLKNKLEFVAAGDDIARGHGSSVREAGG